jgi:glyoxylase I family protein
MRIEHLALNVLYPVEMALWYESHLGFRTIKRLSNSPFTHFLSDSDGRMMIEIYHNPQATVPSYALQDPLELHLAFTSSDPATDRERLVLAGAHFVDEQHLEDGTHLIMLRDPWGLALQLCKRGTPLLPSLGR